MLGNSIWNEMRRMQNLMDSMFDNYFMSDPFWRGSQTLLGGPSESNKAITKTNYRQPLADIQETDKEVIATIELPGVDKKDIVVNATDEGVGIKVEKNNEQKAEDKKKGMYRYERSYSGFYRFIPTPDGVDTANINASYNNGVLELKMPKIESKKKGKQIPVK